MEREKYALDLSNRSRSRCDRFVVPPTELWTEEKTSGCGSRRFRFSREEPLSSGKSRCSTNLDVKRLCRINV